MFNFENHGRIHGRLAEDPVIKKNKDGSRKVMVAINVTDPQKNIYGEYTTETITCEGFIPAGNPGNGPYATIRKNDLVSVAYSLKTKDYGPAPAHIIPQIELIRFDKEILPEKEETPKPEPEPVKQPSHKNTAVYMVERPFKQ